MITPAAATTAIAPSLRSVRHRSRIWRTSISTSTDAKITAPRAGIGRNESGPVSSARRTAIAAAVRTPAIWDVDPAASDSLVRTRLMLIG